MSSEIDFDALRKRISSSHTVQNIVKYIEELSSKDLSARVIEVKELHQHLQRKDSALRRSMVIDTLKDLQKTGLGHFVVGRRGGESRFVTSLLLTEITQRIRNLMAENQSKVLEERAGAMESARAQHIAATQKTTDSLAGRDDGRKFVMLRFELDNDFETSVTIPEILSRTDAMKLANFIKRITIDSKDEEVR